MSIKDSPTFSFETVDAFGWNGFADKLEMYLEAERNFVDGSLVVSLNAPFGSGKTTFLRMWKDRLDTRRKCEPTAPMCILLNAWEDDFCGDPLFSLIDAIEKEASAQSTEEELKGRVTSLVEASQDLGWFIVGMANSAVTHWTGLDPAGAGEFAEAKKGKSGNKDSKPDILGAFRSRKNALRNFKNALRALTSDSKGPTIVLVDELDRCRPDYAIHYLETIKHIFDVEGVTFILAVDLHQLENSARSIFGNDLNFPEYYRKFAHRNILLPKADEAGIKSLIRNYIRRYLDDPEEKTHRRKSLLNFGDTAKMLVNLSLSLHLTPRQIQEAFRMLGHLTSVTEKKFNNLNFQSASSIIFLTFLSFSNPTRFSELMLGKVSLDELLKTLSELPISKDRNWWAFVLAPILDRNIPPEEAYPKFVQHGFFPNDSTPQGFIHKWNQFATEEAGELNLWAKKIHEIESFEH